MNELIYFLAIAVVPLACFLSTIGSATIGWLFYRAVYLRYYADPTFNDRLIFYLQEENAKQREQLQKTTEEQSKILEFILKKA